MLTKLLFVFSMSPHICMVKLCALKQHILILPIAIAAIIFEKSFSLKKGGVWLVREAPEHRGEYSIQDPNTMATPPLPAGYSLPIHPRMTRKHKEERRPQKPMEFFLLPSHGGGKDGTSTSAPTP